MMRSLNLKPLLLFGLATLIKEDFHIKLIVSLKSPDDDKVPLVLLYP